METKINKLKAWGSRNRETIGKVIVGAGCVGIIGGVVTYIVRTNNGVQLSKPKPREYTREERQTEINELQGFVDLLQEELDAS